MPTITDRDFVIATVASPTILVEPEKTEEAAAEGETPAEGTETEGTTEGEEKKADDVKEKTGKPADDKPKAAADKGQSSGKEKETKKK